MLKKSIIYLLPLLFMTINTDNCSSGCLICASLSDICLLCDSMNFYAKNGFTCKYEKIDNCKATLDGLNCAECDDKFFLDPNTKKCTAVTAAIEQCVRYSSVDKCSLCATNYFVNDEFKCAQIEQNVQSCLHYATANTCQICTDTIINDKGTVCEIIDNADQCAFYSGVLSCTSCNDSYTFFRSKYLIDLQTTRKYLQSFYNYLAAGAVNIDQIFPESTNVCLKSMNNCVKTKSYKECEVCEDGYYIESGFCVKNPTDKINFCHVYSNATTCTICENHYYVEAGICKKHKDILNCITYSNNVAQVCDECESDFYFNTTEKLCVKREKSIANCAKHISDQQACKECQFSYILTPNNLSCLSMIPKCNIFLFIPGNDGDYNLLCKKCNDGFYISTVIENNQIITSCELPKQAIEGCKSYQSEFQCIECRQNYYLANFKCHLHDQSIIKNLICEVNDNMKLNDCSVCPNDNFLYKLYNYCKKLDQPIEECDQYQDAETCYQCNESYYVKDKKCTKSTISECKTVQRDANKCLQCNEQKRLFPNVNSNDNQCIKIFSHIENECEDYTFDITSGYVGCESCTAGFYPNVFVNANFTFCVVNSELETYREKMTNENITFLTECYSADFVSKRCLYCNQKSLKTVIHREAGNCTASCESSQIIQTFKMNSHLPESFMECIPLTGLSNVDNCKRIDYDLTTKPEGTTTENMTAYCVECHDNFAGVVQNLANYKYAHFDKLPLGHFTDNVLNDVSYWSHNNKIPLFQECLEFTTAIFSSLVEFTEAGYNSLESGVIKVVDPYADLSEIEKARIFANCYTIFEATKQVGGNTTNLLGCGSCKFGMTGVVIPTMSTYAIHVCKEMPECDTSVHYTGLGNHDSNAKMDLYVRCHKCLDPTKIITFTLLRTWFMPEDISTVEPSKAETTKSGLLRQNECTVRGFHDTNTQFFPNNCAVQLVITDKKLQPYTLDLLIPPNPLCVACKPLYKPSLSDLNIEGVGYKYIISCDLIANCKSSNQFNVCDECDADYVLEYDSTQIGLTSGHTCIINPIVGCLIGALNEKCYKCKPGYFLNIKGICDDVGIIETCKNIGTMVPYNTAYDYLNNYPFGQGCLQCKQGVFSIRFNFVQKFCISNNADPETAIGLTHYIQNCQNYGFTTDTGLICNVCVNGFYLTKDGKECVVESITNCSIYERIAGTTTYKCHQCINKFYNENGTCFPGAITGCLIYNNKENCIECEEGNIATRIINNQFTICLKVAKSVSNCSQYDGDEGFKGVLRCDKCINNSYAVLFDLAIKTCGEFYTIDNCFRYDINESFVTSSFACLECKEAFYAAQNVFPSVCKQRSNFPIYNCLKYNLFDDTCDECISNYYLSTDKIQCHNNPTGIPGCRIYLSRSECTECSENYYLFDKQCYLVPEENKVLNCYTYSRDLRCVMCGKGFSLKNGECIAFALANCVTLGFAEICDECKTGYHFFTKECETLNVSDCKVYLTANICQECNDGFYLASGRCFEANPITDCVIYSSKEECKTCKPGLILEPDRKRCSSLQASENSFKNPNCYSYERLRTCVVCKDGYYFDDTTCVACNAGTGCRYCKPDDDTKCVMCQSGYYMNKDKVCTANEPISNGNDVQQDTELPDYYQDLSATLYSVKLVVILLVVQLIV